MQSQKDKAIQASIGKKIKDLRHDEGLFYVDFEDGTTLSIWDDGQSCCENRYLTVDDKLSEFIGATFVGLEEKDCRPEDNKWDEGNCDYHDIRFVDVNTNLGAIQIVNHNVHNGYYGGFAVCARLS